MRWFLVFATMAFGTASHAESVESLHAKAMAALEDCQSAWLDRTRREAVAVIEQSAAGIVVRLNPLSRGYLIDLRRAKEATEAHGRCAKIIHPDQ